MKAIKIITGILFTLVLIAMGVGYYFLQFQENELVGNKIIGFSTLVLVFIVMPLFLYFRLQGKKLKDYTLTPDNIERWRKQLDKDNKDDWPKPSQN